MSNETYTYKTLTREEGQATYTFAEIKYGKIVSINKHWVPLEEYRKFFGADSMFIDITGVTIDGELPAVGDVVSCSTTNGYEIQHYKAIYSMAEIKQYQIEKLKLIRNEKELEPVVYNDHYYDADKDSLMRLDKARQSLEDNGLESIEWTTADNARVTITVSDFKGINTAIAVRSNTLHVRYNELKTFINAITDEKYISLITSIGWDFDITTDLDTLLPSTTEETEENNSSDTTESSTTEQTTEE